MRAKPVYDSIICFGDSLTQQASGPGGFVAGLQDAYQRRLEGEADRMGKVAMPIKVFMMLFFPCTVVSRGFSGYTSRQGTAHEVVGQKESEG